MLDEILQRLQVIEGHLMQLDRLLRDQSSSPENEWVTSTDFCRLVGLKDTKALTYQMSKGIIRGDAIRNIGTPRRPRWRFHRVKAVEQFLNRSAHFKRPAA